VTILAEGSCIAAETPMIGRARLRKNQPLEQRISALATFSLAGPERCRAVVRARILEFASNAPEKNDFSEE